MNKLNEVKSVAQFQEIAKSRLQEDVFEYLYGGADDLKTAKRNINAYDFYQLKPKRLIDVSKIDTTIKILDEEWVFPFALAPVGLQGYFHPDGELASAKAASKSGCQMVVSTVSNYSYCEIAEQFERKPWFQLYPTVNRNTTASLIDKAASNGCTTLVLTIDVPVLGNRQKHRKHLVEATEGGQMRLGNFEGARGTEAFNDPSMTWDIIPWIRERTDMNIVLKGLLTPEDAKLSLDIGVDGIIISNHGGRQLESGISTIEVLEEIAAVVNNSIPIMLDGGIRRGTDVLKAIALGAKAVFLGRSFCYGLASYGVDGVTRVIEILQEEIVRNMQLLGAPNINSLNKSFIRKPIF